MSVFELVSLNRLVHFVPAFESNSFSQGIGACRPVTDLSFVFTSVIDSLSCGLSLSRFERLLHCLIDCFFFLADHFGDFANKKLSRFAESPRFAKRQRASLVQLGKR